MRGQTEHPLNWVLVLIGGIVFLLVFFVLIRAVVTGHERSADTTTIAGLRAVVREAQASPGTVMNASVPAFTTRCDRGTLIAQLDRQDTPFDGQILFTTPLSGGNLALWSESFELPGPVATVTYLIPKKTLVLVENDAALTFLYDAIPPEVRKKQFVAGALAFDAKGYDAVVVVFSDSTAVAGAVTSAKNVYGLKVSPEGGAPPYGKVRYFGFTSPSSWAQSGADKNYFGTALLVGAVFAGTAAQYACGVQSLERRTDSVFRIQKQRAGLLKTAAGVPPLCESQYGIAASKYDLLLLKKISAPATAMSDWAGYRSALFQANQVLGRNNCALLY